MATKILHKLRNLDGSDAFVVDGSAISAYIVDVTASAAEINQLDDAGALQADFIKLHALGSSAAEIDAAADVSARVQTLTASGAVTAGKQSLQLNHASVVIASTIADASLHQGIFHIKDISATGTAAHTVTITTGTFDGTNKVATLNALNECLVVYFDSAGNGTILENVGAVALSA